MKSYEEISNRIMERGDEIIASRRNRSEKIKRTSFIISGMCAVLIVGIGIKHTLFYKDPHNAFSDNNISITQKTTGDITTSLSVNATSADYNSNPANNTTQTKVSNSVVTTVNTDTEPTKSSTNVNEIIVTNTDIITDEAYKTSDTITTAKTVTADTSVSAVVTEYTVTNSQSNKTSTITSRITTTFGITNPNRKVTTNPNRRVTTIKTTATEIRTVTSSSLTTTYPVRSEDIVSDSTVTTYTQPVTTDTRSVVSSRSAYIVIKKPENNRRGGGYRIEAVEKDYMYYVSDNSIVSEEKIGALIGRNHILNFYDSEIEVEVNVYKIKGEDNAVAVLIPGYDEYYRFININ